MCSPCSCGHEDTFSVENVNVYRFYCPKVEFHAFSWNQLVLFFRSSWEKREKDNEQDHQVATAAAAAEAAFAEAEYAKA